MKRDLVAQWRQPDGSWAVMDGPCPACDGRGRVSFVSRSDGLGHVEPCGVCKGAGYWVAGRPAARRAES